MALASLTQLFTHHLEIPVQYNATVYSTEYGLPINVSEPCFNYCNGFKKHENESGSTVFSSYHMLIDDNGYGRISPLCELIVDKHDTVSGILYHNPVTLSMMTYSPLYKDWDKVLSQALSIFGIIDGNMALVNDEAYSAIANFEDTFNHYGSQASLQTV
jgi:hypothetical protein